MNLLKRFLTVAIIAFQITLPMGCSTSVLVDVWNDPSPNEPALKKILIVAVRKEPAMRRIWEDAFVSELTKLGIKSEASYNYFPIALPDTNQIINTVHNNGFDGIIVTRLLYDETKTHYVKDYVTTEIVSRYNVFRKRYDTYFRDIQHAGYIESQIINRRSFDVWAFGKTEKMIWSATSNSPEAGNEKGFQKNIAGLVISELKSNGIIKYER